MKIAIVGDIHIQENNPRVRKDEYLETVLGKLKYLLENNDKVICLGDLFDKCQNSTLLFNRLFKFFSLYPNKFISILGNHDIFHSNQNDLDRTSIGSLYYTGAIDIKTDTFTIDGQTFAVSKCEKDITNIPIDEDNDNILLGHNFFEDARAPKESLTRDDLIALNYKWCLLGHDHSTYAEEFIGNTALVRMGSLTRITSDTYNFTRVIQYYQFDTELREFKRIQVPHKPVKEVFIESAFEKKALRKEINFIAIGEALAKFNKSSEGIHSLDKALDAVGTPNRHKVRIKGHHIVNGLAYN